MVGYLTFWLMGESCGAPSPWDRRVALGVVRVVASMAECNSVILEGQPHSWPIEPTFLTGIIHIT
jgi:hypothetical protein